MPSHYGKHKKKGDLNKDGKMSKYETRRDRAIKNAIMKKKRNSLKVSQWPRRRIIFFPKNYLKLEVNLEKLRLVGDQAYKK